MQSAVIGAMALAAHGFSRSTKDFDLATDTDPFSHLRNVAAALRTAGFQVAFVTPDEDDSLGGVVTVSGEDFDEVRIVNFWNPLRPGSRNPGADAVRLATESLVSGSSLRVVDLPHLIALKLYAGGPKSLGDVMELLVRNTNVARESIREVCAKYELEEDFDSLVAKLTSGGS